jgi:hypothetical protein
MDNPRRYAVEVRERDAETRVGAFDVDGSLYDVKHQLGIRGLHQVGRQAVVRIRPKNNRHTVNRAVYLAEGRNRWIRLK